MKKTVLLAIVAAFVLAPAVEAATNQGDMYFTFDGMWQRTSLKGGGAERTTQVGVGLEYFLTKEISVTPNIDYARTKFDDGKITLWGLGIDGKYHFMTDSNIVPYVGGFLGYNRLKFSDDEGSDKGSGMSYGPLVGVKMFATQNTVFFVEYRYSRFTSDLKDVYKNQNAVMFGVAYKFN